MNSRNGLKNLGNGTKRNATSWKDQEFLINGIARVQTTWKCNLWVKRGILEMKTWTYGDREVKILVHFKTEVDVKKFVIKRSNFCIVREK